MLKTLSIIGCGKVGKTLGYLLANTTDTHIILHDIYNRSLESANEAIEFLGSGNAVEQLNQLRPADVFMLTVPDDHITTISASLARLNLIHPNTLIFHCSGSLSAEILSDTQKQGALTASVHPILSFASPDLTIQHFAGTPCGIEGNYQAVKFLQPLFTKIGGYSFTINPQFKTLYHAGTVIVCSYLVCLIAELLAECQQRNLDQNKIFNEFCLLNKERLKHFNNDNDWRKNSEALSSIALLFSNQLMTLLNMSLKCYDQAGITAETALQLLTPLINSTLRNVHHQGLLPALTGPIARGDVNTVQQHCAALTEFDKAIANAYKQWGLATLELAQGLYDSNKKLLEHLRFLLRVDIF